MKRNCWCRLPRTGRMVYVRKGTVSHAAVYEEGKRIVQIPYKDKGNGKLFRLSELLSLSDISRLEVAGKIVWVDIEETYIFSF